MIQWLFLLLGWFIIPIVHKLLLKWIPYRWVINSIIYPYTKYKLSRRYELMNKEDRIIAWSDFHLMDHWSKGYWFTERLERHILLNYIDGA